MTEKATLLVEPSDASDGNNVAKVLDFFGVPVTRLSVEDFFARDKRGDGHEKEGILCKASVFSKLLKALAEKGKGREEFWQENVHSALVYAGEDFSSFEELTREVSGDASAALVQGVSDAEWTVSGSFPEFSKSMAEVQVTTKANTGAAVLSIKSSPRATALISSRNGAALLKIDHQTVPVFLSTTPTIIDIDTALTERNFDIRQHFLAAAPLVMYVKWAFARVCWNPPKTTACLVIDDPLLRPRYGFLNFKHVLELMRRHNFSTSIAFIPWNWRRSASKVVRLFKESDGKYSLSIHGCDHTGGEFGGQNDARLTWKSKQATDRMARHESRTGIRHDHVMVFPQGVFSEAAIRVLKHGDFIGIVNSEVISTDAQPRAITIADFWNVAVMSYDNFPIFTRRYPSDGVENFAFDILLGKPCIVVIHHDDCHHDCRQLVTFIDRLNALKTPMAWHSLAEVVRRSFRQKQTDKGETEIEMYGGELRVINASSQRNTFRISKRESDPSSVREICLDAQPIPWRFAGNRIVFEIDLEAGENKVVRMTFSNPPVNGFKGEPPSYRAKAMVRRLLSEIRDNYVTRNPFST